MRPSKRFASSFGILASSSRVLLGVAMGLLPSCGLDDTQAADDRVAEGADPAAGETDSVCTQGHYRCHARIASAERRRLGQRAAAPFGLNPADLKSAYNLVTDRTATAKPTVAIVDAYGYTNLESDLATYRSQFGLPPCTKANGCLKVVNQNGQTAPLPPDPPANDDWTVETALDMDMVSAACPLCNILVVQADDNLGDGLFIAQNAAAALGATVISNSWGGPESPMTTPTELAMAEAFFAQTNIAIFVSAGDDGYNDNGDGPDYPGTSSHVIAVGGTKLVKDPTVPRGWTETAWAKGGSACSLAVTKPAYQTTSPCKFKATTDIAAVGDPDTGLSVYNANNMGWIRVGGTSASAPFIAGIFAATGNGTQTSGAFIASKAAKLHDVTVGNNGECGADTLLCNAAVGWDGPTGYGTPDGAALMPGGASAPGNGSGKQDGDDADGETDVTGGCSSGGPGGGALIALALVGLRRRTHARRAA
jgi:uncharacterized protein (TIGR03382 family)